MKHVLADTGLWIGLFEARDQHHEEAEAIAGRLDLFRLVLPWPILYETLNTRLVRNTLALSRFENYLKRPNVDYLDDTRYRETALNLSLESSRRSRALSLTDCTIRLILDDVGVKIDYLATFNARDFADVCHRRRIELM